MKEQSQPIKQAFGYKGSFKGLTAYLKGTIKQVVPIIEKSN